MWKLLNVHWNSMRFWFLSFTVIWQSYNPQWNLHLCILGFIPTKFPLVFTQWRATHTHLPLWLQSNAFNSVVAFWHLSSWYFIYWVLNHAVAAFLCSAQETAEIHKAFSSVMWFSYAVYIIFSSQTETQTKKDSISMEIAAT